MRSWPSRVAIVYGNDKAHVALNGAFLNYMVALPSVAAVP
jgi:hypothetical protein